MIGTLTGVLASKSPPHLLLEVGGIGYEVEAPMSTFYRLPAIGERIRLLTHLLVREDAHVLYGFATDEERTLFRNLLKVSGVGPRIALAILSGGTTATFAHAVRERDAAALTRIPGVGRKIAERLIVEMRDRLELAGAAPADGELGAGAVAPGAEAEAYGALVSLGYKPVEATRLLKGVGAASASLSTEELIRRALQGAVHS
ncbi:MAG TPA: Holliday junction branch migration protein RuvA [Steroidobacteraceae bacterium]|jgi:Holliday junction DNA helicase RuvA|nr:Holliday junction branch migration protein RuvA [Steroidobacteraceae bacterium]